ncbi:gliding motility-associated C-terminal domain-containing protein [Algoriphagus yeomjeoni]|uniref:CHU domain-containing protein n=1 Tax=Algoriphagus yeomjeoni TaxID=291403 RepID=A0A327PLF0_9BACT|nr:gliding motility-associated C-terminal domain-containing protein [Algoriphagus yeomjeoni]RAI92002.1 CHU domain-containing protein [Algoriphagus yeomjeoni]
MLLLAVASIGLSFSYILENKPNEELAGITSVADPELIGPGILCNISGTVIGSFSGAGDPVTDLYGWKIYGPSGNLLFSKNSGAFQNIDYTFITNGVHKVELEVRRGGIPIAKFTKDVQVIQKPIQILAAEYISCASTPLEIQAIDPLSSNFSSYKFEWKNSTGSIVSTSNTLVTTDEGEFSVRYFIESPSGEKSCDYLLTTNISNISTIVIESSDVGVCIDGEISFNTKPQLSGEWFVQKIGDISKKSFGIRNSLTIRPGSDLIEFGDYEVSFVLSNSLNPACSSEGKINFSYNPEPIFVFESAETSSDCLQADGKLVMKALTDLDYINIEGTSISYGPFKAGDLIEIPNLKSGTYNLIGGLGSCINSLGSVVPLTNPPTALEFTIDDIVGEACTANGKIPGSFQVTMLNGANPNAFYRVVNEKGGVAMNKVLPNSSVFRVELPGGFYFFEIYDDEDECILPSRNKLIIPAKDQTTFQIPQTLNVCQSFGLIPETSQALIFTITRPDLSTEIKNAGEEILLNQKGEYKIVGTLPNQSDICPVEKIILVDLIDPVDFEIILVSEDCTVGNRSYEADIFSRDPSTVLFFWRNEKDEIIGTSQRLDLPPTSFGDYSLEVQPANSQACPVVPKPFIAKEPILSVDVIMTATKLCEFGPKAILNVTTTFPEEVTNVEWRRYDKNGNIEFLNQFDDKYEIEVDEEGTYEAAVFARISSLNKNCELGRTTIQLDLTPEKVIFTVPDSLSICETYDLIPETTQTLQFSLTQPDGTIVDKNAGEAFTLNQSGTYSLYGFDPLISSPNCPEIKEFSVIVNQPIPFEPILFSEDCNGQKTYQAKLTGATASDANIFWYDSNGALIGTDEFLTLDNISATYSLEVQPKGSLPCVITPIEFNVETSILDVPVSLLADPLCPDSPSANIRAEADFSLVTSIEWWYTFPTGEQIELTSERNKEEILAIREGTYEVRIYNNVPCILGFDQVLILRSTDTVRPEVEESYQICPKYDIGPSINPGSFASYEWYFGDQLVSTNSVYKPQSIGNHRLIVYSAEGCAYQTDFTTEEECELKVIYPNAVQPGNPDKEFLIYTNYLIDELDLVILNKWGQVVFECTQTNLISEESTCIWDGTYNGKAIPNGNYAVRINFKNYQQQVSKSDFGSILIIE